MTSSNENSSTAPIRATYINTLFSQLDAQQVETFYRHYRRWQLEQQQLVLQRQLSALELQITNNTARLRLTQPSTFTLAALTRLEAHGVKDVSLLDAMIERGDLWLANTMRLLERCEQIDAIHGDYTGWCRYALEGAYDWLDSMDENDFTAAQNTQGVQGVQNLQSTQSQSAAGQNGQRGQTTTRDGITEEILLQKLRSEDEIVYAMPRNAVQHQAARTIYPLPMRLSYETKVTSYELPFQEIVIPLAAQTSTTHIPSASVELSQEVQHKKSPRYSVVSRILAKVWQV